MGELPQVKLSRQQKMTADELRGLPSIELVDEAGEFIGFLIIPSPIGGMTIWDTIRDAAEGLGVRSNYVIPPKVIEAVSTPLIEKYPNLAKARVARQAKIAKRELVKVQ